MNKEKKTKDTIFMGNSALIFYFRSQIRRRGED